MATNKSLVQGSTGAEVKKLQTALANAGYDIGSSGVDGSYGPATASAVRKYQQDNGLTVDGMAGTETQTKLYGTSKKSSSTMTEQQNTQSTGTVASYYDPASDTAYQQALQALQAASKNAPTYANSYDGQLQDLYNQIVNRDKFSYDINSDALYQQYADQYIQNGKLAMMDSMGQAAALTGGYGSSYGQAVGQQTYNSYLQQLNDIVPELYGQAYEQYQDEGNQLLQQYSMLGDMADDEYAKYQDAYSQWANERSYAQNQADTAYERGYNAWNDTYNINLNKAETLAASGDFSGYAALYGDETASKMQKTWISSNPDIAYRNGMITAEEYKSMTGEYPAGYTAPNTSTGSGGSGGGGTKVKDDDSGNSYTYSDYKAAASSANNSNESLDASLAINEGVKRGELTDSQAKELTNIIRQNTLVRESGKYATKAKQADRL